MLGVYLSTQWLRFLLPERTGLAAKQLLLGLNGLFLLGHDVHDAEPLCFLAILLLLLIFCNGLIDLELHLLLHFLLLLLEVLLVLTLLAICKTRLQFRLLSAQ